MDGAMEDKWNTSAADIEGIQRKGENKPLMLSKTGRYPGALLLPEGADVSKLHHHIRPIRLHMELMRDDSSQAEEVKTTYVLQTYGQVTYGDTISRDVIVPDDIIRYRNVLDGRILICIGLNCHRDSLNGLRMEIWENIWN